MLRFFSKFFRIKTKELEAKLLPTAECSFGGVGEIELNFFNDGEIRTELSLKHSGVPDSTNLEFFCDGVLIGTTEVSGGYAKKYETISNRNIKADVGSIAELKINGAVLYKGQFRPD